METKQHPDQISIPAHYGVITSAAIVDQLSCFGFVRYFISPGYRNVPFIEAIRLLKPEAMVSCFDERAAAYEALGYAKSGVGRAVLLCTSGTAGANYLPAVMEASHEQVGLLAITCDRPFELIGTASNQVTRQSEFFGSFAKSRLLLPTAGPELALRDLKARVRAFLESLRRFPTGVGHLNLPLREPLEPKSIDEPAAERYRSEYLQQRASSLYPPVEMGLNAALQTESQAVIDVLATSERPFLIVGRIDSRSERDAVASWLSRWPFPKYLDICSSLKYQFDSLEEPGDRDCYNFLNDYRPDLIVHLGRRLVTRQFDRYFAGQFSGSILVLGPEQASFHGLYGPQTLQVQGDLKASLGSIDADFFDNQCNLAAQMWRQHLLARSSQQESVRSPLVDHLKLVYQLASESESPIFAGNSSLIRSLDELHGLAVQQAPQVFANRGVSGIEGLLATAKGVSLALSKRVFLLIGDISLLHDMNSLMSLSHEAYQVCVIVLNNFGGGIFRQMPIASYEALADPWVTTPHALQFSQLCKFSGLSYRKISLVSSDLEAFKKLLVAHTGSQMIELMDDRFQEEVGDV